jgi:hypothetical protein
VETENLHGRKFSAAGLNTGLHAFLDASLLGWEYAMTHTQEIIDLLIEAYGVKKQTDHLSYEPDFLCRHICHCAAGHRHRVSVCFQQKAEMGDS